MAKKIIPVFLLLALAGGWFLYGRMGGSSAVGIVEPVRKNAVQAVYATGTVEPGVMIPISPRSTARLVGIYAEEGDKVEKGEVLAQFEDTDLRNSLVELKAREDLAKKEFDRRKSLKERGFATQEALDQAVADLESVQANIAKTEAQLEFLQLLAPEDGLIIRHDGEIGEIVAARQPVFWMSCCEPLRVSADVDEEDIPLVEPGQKVLLHADAYPGKVFDGVVDSITPKGDPVARSYRVRVKLEDDGGLMIGMTAETNIIIREKQNALLVPASAVKDGVLWVVRDGSLQKREVKTGVSGFQSVEITQGLDEDSMVVRSPQEDFKEGKQVSARKVEWAPE